MNFQLEFISTSTTVGAEDGRNISQNYSCKSLTITLSANSMPIIHRKSHNFYSSFDSLNPYLQWNSSKTATMRTVFKSEGPIFISQYAVKIDSFHQWAVTGTVSLKYSA